MNSDYTSTDTADAFTLRILLALRRIIHSVDVYSRQLNVMHNITGPQLLCLDMIVRNGPIIQSELGKKLSISVSTINGILDRLEVKNFVMRERKDRDRRKVIITATERGREMISNAPLPIQDRLLRAVQQMPVSEQISLTESLERITQLMGFSDATATEQNYR
ncbi:MarR family transcriptional regulator [bacterium]|nr:MarR family transcriptional regulator [candidate division CSSED10-310 bacterium]